MEFDSAMVARLIQGNTFEAGVLFPGMAPTEKITWQVIESQLVDSGLETQYLRVTSRLHWQDVYLGNAIIILPKEGKPFLKGKAHG